VKIFCDMDGTLTDFVGQCNELLSFDIFKYQEDHGMESIWEHIEKFGVDFWTKIKWLPKGKELWEFVKPFNPVILSAIPSTEYAIYPEKGKNIWIDRELGKDVPRIICRRGEKVDNCHSGDILIDDYEKTIIEWKDKGGIGILHKDVDSTIKELKLVYDANK
jgi:hypothetical protein